MKILSEKLRIISLAFFMSTAFGMVACSTGTSEGDVNVEESDSKDRHPDEHNVTELEQGNTVDTVDIDNAYEKTDDAQDRDNDGLADQPR